MEVVTAFACSPAGFLISHYDKAPTDQRDAVYAGFVVLRETLADTREVRNWLTIAGIVEDQPMEGPRVCPGGRVAHGLGGVK
jgi:hypothetical protein